MLYNNEDLSHLDIFKVSRQELIKYYETIIVIFLGSKDYF